MDLISRCGIHWVGFFRWREARLRRVREEQALCCVFPVLHPSAPPVPICIVTAESHPSERPVGGCSGEKILLWEPSAERDLIAVWLLQWGKRWAWLACESQGCTSAWAWLSSDHQEKKVMVKLWLCLVASAKMMLCVVISGLSISGNYFSKDNFGG